MEQLINIVHSTFTEFQIAIMAIMISSFFLFFLIYLVQFLRSVTTKNISTDEPYKDISVIVVVKDDLDFLKKNIYYLINQEYKENYQIVIVDNSSSDEDYIEELTRVAERYPDLIYVTKVPLERYRATKKLASTIGIKGAKYENVLLVSSKAIIDSPNWLEAISRKFNKYNIVTAYSRVSKDGSCKASRARNIVQSLLYMSSIIRNRAYMVNEVAYGFTKSLFFNHGGYSINLRLNRGENDLFIQSITKLDNKIGLVIEKDATIEIEREGNRSDFMFEESYNLFARRFYPLSKRLYIGFYQLLNILFTISAVVVAINLLPVNIYLFIAAILLLIIKLSLQASIYYKLSKRTNDKIPYLYMLLYDLIAPFEGMSIAIKNRFKPRKDVWI